MARGLFITLEGIDGAGKTTQFNAIADTLRAAGRDPVTTREPGGTALGERLRELLLHEPMQPETEALLMFAARQQHVLELIQPSLSAGRDVVCDRFTDATLAYQGAGKGMDLPRLHQLADWVHAGVQPDLTLLIDLPAETAAARLRQQGRVPDRFEQESLAFFQRVRAQYLQLATAQPQRWVVLDGSQTAEQVKIQVEQAVRALLERSTSS